MITRIVTATEWLDASGGGPSAAITIEGDRIASVAPADAPDGVIAIPPVVNAHDHARPIRTNSIGGFNKPLETWLHRLALLVPVDPYLANAAALGRAALGGQGAAMIHCTRPMGLTDLVTEARAVRKAASDVGIPVAFGIGMRDQNPLVYGPHDALLESLPAAAREEIEARFLAPMASIEAQIAAFDAVAQAVGGPGFDVQYGPNGPQWVSEPFWRAIAEASARTGRRITTHLFETKYQRDWADRAYPGGLVRHWRDIGLLSPRLTLAHCVHARPDELEMIAEAGCTIAVNASSNLALRSGIAPVADMVRYGCKVALGIDGQAFDDDDDALREIRLLWALHGGWGFESEVSPRQVLKAAFENGRKALSLSAGGRIAPGMPANLLLLDRAALDEDAVMAVDPLDLMFARAAKKHVRELIVDGRTIVRDGRVLGLDIDAIHDELRALYRHGVTGRTGFVQAWPEFEAALSGHYRMRLGCC